jgi:sirohydrochlorin cobaltochelatase
MASAPMKYRPDGAVDWINMWDTYCVLGREGGPPHRDSMLDAQEDADIASDGYRFAIAEIGRGIREVSGLDAAAAAPGWIAVRCHSPGMARWLAESIELENVQARADGASLLVPVGDYFTLKGEIKNVITAVAKTTHYWREHLPLDVKRALMLQTQIDRLKQHVRGWTRHRAS